VRLCSPRIAEPLGALAVGQHQDVEEFGAGSRTEGVQALPEAGLKLVGPHGWRLRGRTITRAFDHACRVKMALRPSGELPVKRRHAR